MAVRRLKSCDSEFSFLCTELKVFQLFSYRLVMRENEGVFYCSVFLK